jgi:ABC-type lipoprotein export system ATPase subunit
VATNKEPARYVNPSMSEEGIIVTHDYSVGKMADKIVVTRDRLIEKEFKPVPFWGGCC